MKKKMQDEVIYENYKEPLRKFKEGYGYIGTIAKRKSDGKVQCHFCGEFFEQITNDHVKVCTEGNIENLIQYREAVSLGKATALYSDKRKDQLRTKYLNETKMNKHYIPFTKKQSDEGNLKSAIRTRGKRWKKSLEYKNKMGTCPDQLLEKIQKLSKVYNGKVPTKREFVKYYGGRYIGAIYTTFGSYPEAVRQAGFKPIKDEQLEKYENENLIVMLQNFYKTTGRTPVSSDFNGRDLPSWRVYVKRFGSINEAREIAGVPKLIQLANHKVIEVK